MLSDTILWFPVCVIQFLVAQGFITLCVRKIQCLARALCYRCFGEDCTYPHVTITEDLLFFLSCFVYAFTVLPLRLFDELWTLNFTAGVHLAKLNHKHISLINHIKHTLINHIKHTLLCAFPFWRNIVCEYSIRYCYVKVFSSALGYMWLSLHTQVVCKVQRDYHGNRCPLGFGLMTCLCAPKCDEGKISVQCDDTVTVTRWQTSVWLILLPPHLNSQVDC